MAANRSARCGPRNARRPLARSNNASPVVGGCDAKSSACASSSSHERGLSSLRACASRQSRRRRRRTRCSIGQSCAVRKARCGCGSGTAWQTRSTRRRQSSASHSRRPSSRNFASSVAWIAERWTTSCAAYSSCDALSGPRQPVRTRFRFGQIDAEQGRDEFLVAQSETEAGHRRGDLRVEQMRGAIGQHVDHRFEIFARAVHDGDRIGCGEQSAQMAVRCPGAANPAARCRRRG